VNREQVLKFWSEVEGKKIRWYSWPKNQYIVPTALVDTSIGLMTGVVDRGYIDEVYIHQGFHIDSGMGWVWFTDFNDELEDL
jgi:hypothetical protein